MIADIDAEPADDGLARDDLDLRIDIAQQRRRFERGLAAADDRDVLARKPGIVPCVRGVRGELRGEMRRKRGFPGGVRETRGDDDALGRDRGAVFKPHEETARRRLDRFDQTRIDIGNRFPLEPLAVTRPFGHGKPPWKLLVGRNFIIEQTARIGGVGQMRRQPFRAQHHALRQGLPEAHHLAENHWLEAGRA